MKEREEEKENIYFTESQAAGVTECLTWFLEDQKVSTEKQKEIKGRKYIFCHLFHLRLVNAKAQNKMNLRANLTSSKPPKLLGIV